MRHFSIAAACAFLVGATAFAESPLDWVDPMIGTEGEGSEYGGMQPMTGVPFGAMQLVPMTRLSRMAQTSFNALDRDLLGFVLTRQPAIWMGEWGEVRIFFPKPKRIESIEPTAYFTRVKAGGRTYELTASSRVAYIRSDDHELSGCLAAVGSSTNRTQRTSTRPLPNFRSWHVAKTDGNVLKVAVSLIGEAEARAAFAELPDDFDAAVARTRSVWEKYLSRFTIDADDRVKRIFYTGIYHALHYPREITENGRHYSGIDDRVHDGPGFTCYSLWDTYRVEHPLLTLLAPDRVDAIVEGLVTIYREGGWLPLWPNLGYTGQMVGAPAETVIADAYVKGFRGFDVETAWVAVRKNATVPQVDDLTRRWEPTFDDPLGPPETRPGLTRYMSDGYVAADETEESVSHTLDYALNDANVACFAAALGRKEDAAYFAARAKNYTNLWNVAAARFWPRAKDGSFIPPEKAPGAYTETNADTSRWCVPHDVEGLARLMGGRAALVAGLDDYFERVFFRPDTVGNVSVHGNEPSHHVAYLYNRVGAYERTCRRVREIMDRCYSDNHKGFDGNDDCGAMSAWFVMSALGIYPLDPGCGWYELGTPVVRGATLRFGAPYRPAELKIIVRNYAPTRWLVTRVTFNGRELSERRIRHTDLVGGGELVFEMSE